MTPVGNTCWNTTGAACTSPVYAVNGGTGGSLTAGGGGTATGGSATCDMGIPGQAAAQAAIASCTSVRPRRPTLMPSGPVALEERQVPAAQRAALAGSGSAKTTISTERNAPDRPTKASGAGGSLDDFARSGRPVPICPSRNKASRLLRRAILPRTTTSPVSWARTAEPSGPS
jgi:hypothetical protein